MLKIMTVKMSKLTSLWRKKKKGKTTTLISPWKKLGKKLKAETEKLNKSLTTIQIDSITKYIELVYARGKLACNKIGLPLRTLKRNTKPARETILEGQIKNYKKQ